MCQFKISVNTSAAADISATAPDGQKTSWFDGGACRKLPFGGIVFIVTEIPGTEINGLGAAVVKFYPVIIVTVVVDKLFEICAGVFIDNYLAVDLSESQEEDKQGRKAMQNVDKSPVRLQINLGEVADTPEAREGLAVASRKIADLERAIGLAPA